MLVLCILGASTQTVKFSGEETMVSEINELAVVYTVQKWETTLHLTPSAVQVL